MIIVHYYSINGSKPGRQFTILTCANVHSASIYSHYSESESSFVPSLSVWLLCLFELLVFAVVSIWTAYDCRNLLHIVNVQLKYTNKQGSGTKQLQIIDAPFKYLGLFMVAMLSTTVHMVFVMVFSTIFIFYGVDPSIITGVDCIIHLICLYFLFCYQYCRRCDMWCQKFDNAIKVRRAIQRTVQGNERNLSQDLHIHSDSSTGNANQSVDESLGQILYQNGFVDAPTPSSIPIVPSIKDHVALHRTMSIPLKGGAPGIAMEIALCKTSTGPSGKRDTIAFSPSLTFQKSRFLNLGHLTDIDIADISIFQIPTAAKSNRTNTPTEVARIPSVETPSEEEHSEQSHQISSRDQIHDEYREILENTLNTENEAKLLEMEATNNSTEIDSMETNTANDTALRDWIQSIEDSEWMIGSGIHDDHESELMDRGIASCDRQDEETDSKSKESESISTGTGTRVTRCESEEVHQHPLNVSGSQPTFIGTFIESRASIPIIPPDDQEKDESPDSPGSTPSPNEYRSTTLTWNVSQIVDEIHFQESNPRISVPSIQNEKSDYSGTWVSTKL